MAKNNPMKTLQHPRSLVRLTKFSISMIPFKTHVLNYEIVDHTQRVAAKQAHKAWEETVSRPIVIILRIATSTNHSI